MRKLWCAGAVACGILLLGAAPAQAEPLPNPGVAEAPLNALGYALEPTNGWRITSPLASDPLSGQPLATLDPGGGRKLLQLEPGADSDLTNSFPAPRRAHGAEKRGDRRPLVPAADVISGTRPDQDRDKRPSGALGGVPVSGVPMPMAGQDFTVAGAPVDGLVGSLPLVGSLSPSGVSAVPGARVPAADERPVARTERKDGDFPLFGGLDGTTAAVSGLQQRVIDVKSDFSGLPIGGSPVSRSVRSTPPVTASSTTPATITQVAPAEPAEPASAATPAPATQRGFSATEADDPRLYEEPVDGFVAK